MKNSRGSALVLTLAIMMMLSILSVSILGVSVADTKRVVYQEKHTKAYYAAYSGADAMAAYLAANPGQAQSIIDKTSSKPGTGLVNSEESFKVTVKPTTGNDLNQLLVTSVGQCTGGQSSTVRLTLKLTHSTIFDQAIFADQFLDLGGNTAVVGNVGTNASTAIIGSNVSGNITLGPDATAADIANVQSSLQNGFTVLQLGSKIIFPAIDQSKWNSAATYTSGDITLTNGEVRYLKATDLKQGMNVTGEGELHLLVTGTLEMKGNNAISTPGNAARVYVYYTGTTITFKGTPSFRGLIYAPDANMECKGGGNGDFVGSIICKSYNGPQSAASSIKQDPNLNVNSLAITSATVYKRIRWSD